MKRTNLILTVILAGLLLGLAFAQGGTGDSPSFNWDFAAWFASSAALARLGIVPLVGWLRKHAWTSLDGALVVVIDVVLGLAAAFIGNALHWLDGNTLAVATFGVQAGLIAAGWVAVDKANAAATGEAAAKASPTPPETGTIPR